MRWKLRTSRWKPTSQPCEDSMLLRNDFAAFLYSVVDSLLKLPDMCRKLEAEHLKMKTNFAALRE